MKLILILSVLMSVNVYAQKQDSVKATKKALKKNNGSTIAQAENGSLSILKGTKQYPFRMQMKYSDGTVKILQGRTREELQKQVDEI